MKKVLRSNICNKEYVRSLPMLYTIEFHNFYCVCGYRFSGKCDKDGTPLVWIFCENNNKDEFRLVRLDNTSGREVYSFTTNERNARLIADMLQNVRNYNEENIGKVDKKNIQHKIDFICNRMSKQCVYSNENGSCKLTCCVMRED